MKFVGLLSFLLALGCRVEAPSAEKARRNVKEAAAQVSTTVKEGAEDFAKSEAGKKIAAEAKEIGQEVETAARKGVVAAGKGIEEAGKKIQEKAKE